MAWQSHKNVPSDASLKAYDDRMADQENEIRRPGRKINVISNEDYDRMLEAMDEERRKEEELQIFWQIKYLEAIRQRNNMIRYKLFRLFKGNFKIDTSDADTVSKQPLARAIVAVCNSITKDALLYINMAAIIKMEVVWSPELLGKYVEESTGITIDADDFWSIMEAICEKKSLLELISSQVKADLKEVTAALELHKKLPSMPGYSDPKFVEMLKSAVPKCIKKQDWVMARREAAMSESNLEKKYVAAVHEAFDEASMDRGLQGMMEGKPRTLKVNPEQLKALKSLLNTKSSIRAFYDSSKDTEWSKNVDGLSEEKKVLESLIDSKSDVILRIIDETIAETYLTHNKLVQESAKVRNYVSSRKESRPDNPGVLPAGKTEEFDKACKEESVKFKSMEEDTAYKKLFPRKNTDYEHLKRDVGMLSTSGIM